MILDNHNDGGCYKLTIEYTDYQEPENFEPETKYCEDFDELLEYAIERRNYYISERGLYIIDFRIQDDSK